MNFKNNYEIERERERVKSRFLKFTQTAGLVMVFVVAGLFLFSGSASAATESLYVSYLGTGLGNASSCANAWSLATLNTTGNWSVTDETAGKVDPGDEILLCGDFLYNGTIDTTITMVNGGVAGNPITIKPATGETVVFDGAIQSNIAWSDVPAVEEWNLDLSGTSPNHSQFYSAYESNGNRIAGGYYSSKAVDWTVCNGGVCPADGANKRYYSDDDMLVESMNPLMITNTNACLTNNGSILTGIGESTVPVNGEWGYKNPYSTSQRFIVWKNSGVAPSDDQYALNVHCKSSLQSAQLDYDYANGYLTVRLTADADPNSVKPYIVSSGTPASCVITPNGADYITIEGFTCKRTSGDGIYINASTSNVTGVIVQNMTLQNIGGTAIKIDAGDGIAVDGVDVLNNTITNYDSNNTYFYSASTNKAIKLGDWAAPTTATFNDVVVRGNNITQAMAVSKTDNEALDASLCTDVITIISPANTLIESNYINGGAHSIQVGHDTGIGSDCNNTTIRNNWIKNSYDDGIWTKACNDATKILIYGNIIEDPSDDCFDVDGDNTNNRAGRASIFNNTCYSWGGSCLNISQAPGDAVFKNNICYADSAKCTASVPCMLRFEDNSGGATLGDGANAYDTASIIENNIYYVPDGDYSDVFFATDVNSGVATGFATWQVDNSLPDANSLTTNPFLTNVGSSIFTLLSTSLGIDKGEDMNIPTDYAGNSRYDMPSINNFDVGYMDIGAYEYITPPDPTLTSSTHPSESTWYNSKTPVTMAFASPYDTAEKAATTDFIYLINQTASPTAAAVKAGTALDDLATFNAASSITSDGTWYVHAIAQNENETTEYSDNYDTYIIKYDSTAPTGTALSLGTITTSSITTTVSGSTDINAGLHATPYYFDRDSGTATSSWQAGTTWNDTGLTSNTEYTYKVRARDAATSPNISAYTATQAKYTLAPTPTNLAANAVGQTAITLSVDAINNPTAGSSGYYFTNATNNTNSGWIQANTWQDTSLTCGTTYSYTVKYRNGDGTETETISFTQATANCPVAEEEDNTEDLEISDIDYSSTATTITIKWKTNNDADSKVEYGKNTDMNHDKTDSDNEEHHKIILKNLDPDTLYYFKITSEDENGSEDSSDRKSIRTKKASAATVTSFINSLVGSSDGNNTEDKENQDGESIIDQINEIPEKIQEKLEETKFFNTNVFQKAEQKYLSEVRFQIVDKLNNPIPNLQVTLHSKPQTTTTDQDGYATFQNVETGKHTLAFAYQDEKFEKRIAIAEPAAANGTVKAEIITIKAEKDSIPLWVWGIMGGLVVLLIVVWKFKTKTKQT